jgi:hypothetical protein
MNTVSQPELGSLVERLKPSSTLSKPQKPSNYVPSASPSRLSGAEWQLPISATLSTIAAAHMSNFSGCSGKAWPILFSKHH